MDCIFVNVISKIAPSNLFIVIYLPYHNIFPNNNLSLLVLMF